MQFIRPDVYLSLCSLGVTEPGGVNSWPFSSQASVGSVSSLLAPISLSLAREVPPSFVDPANSAVGSGGVEETAAF